MKSVDPDGALKMYMESREWDKCLELAKQQVRRPINLRNIPFSYVTLFHLLLFPFLPLSLSPFLMFIGS